MQRLYIFLLFLILAAFLAGCVPSAKAHPTNMNVPPTATKSLEEYRLKVGASTLAALTQEAQTEVALAIPPADCPITTPEKISFKAPEPYSPDAPWEGMFWHGIEGLWTALQTNGVWSGLPDNPEGYTQKIMWWSDFFVLKDELQPKLIVSGRRLDAEAPPLKFYGATNASADDIGDAMLTGVDFPTLGCWEITGQYKKSELKFVVWVAP